LADDGLREAIVQALNNPVSYESGPLADEIVSVVNGFRDRASAPMTTCTECWGVILYAYHEKHMQWHGEMQERMDDLERGTRELKGDLFSAGIHL
jgi:hypothetical protein